NVIRTGGLLGFALGFFLFASNSVAQRPAPVLEYRRTALLKEGDVENGKRLFNGQQIYACANCHSVDGSSSKAGPDLFAIGDKFGRGEIVDAILAPSATIAEGFNTTTVVTKSGEEISGIIKHATETEIELMGAEGKRVRIAA